jgi:quinol monooxygenase YgiN
VPIIIAGVITIDPDRRAEAIAAGEPHVLGARTQKGCLQYAFCPDPTSDDGIVVLERWADEASLAAHFAGPHYRNMLQTLGAFGLRGADVAKHRVDLSEPVYDADMTPRADFFTA